MADDQHEQSQRDDLLLMTDIVLDETIKRLRRRLEVFGPLVPDRGENLKEKLKRHEEERERRKSCGLEKVQFTFHLSTNANYMNISTVYIRIFIWM
ncbi:Ulp1 peptidase [Sarracenia purpurea var. burkii]